MQGAPIMIGLGSRMTSTATWLQIISAGRDRMYDSASNEPVMSRSLACAAISTHIIRFGAKVVNNRSFFLAALFAPQSIRCSCDSDLSHDAARKSASGTACHAFRAGCRADFLDIDRHDVAAVGLADTRGHEIGIRGT